MYSISQTKITLRESRMSNFRDCQEPVRKEHKHLDLHIQRSSFQTGWGWTQQRSTLSIVCHGDLWGVVKYEPVEYT